MGNWVFIRFSVEETGWKQKLSNSWHGAYGIVARKDPYVTTTKVYFPQKDKSEYTNSVSLTVHLH